MIALIEHLTIIPLLAGRGIWFTKDDKEDFIGIDWFQDSLYGAVDITVSPISAYMGNSEQDSCGIRSILHRICRQSPYSLSYVSNVFHDPRILFDMTGYLPDDADTTVLLPEFEAIYQYCSYHFWNDYVITNCGVLSSVDSCLQNVWIDNYNRNNDWNVKEFCRGAWDTRLGNSTDHKLALVNEYAAFPDGRYAVQVTAESQGSRDTVTRYLPAENIELPQSPENIRGVIVDNYIPYVDSVIVYTIYPYKEGITGMFSGGWSINPSEPLSDRTQNASVFDYLPVYRYYRVGVAVKYSEPMKPDSLGDIWLSAGWGDEVNWTSTSNKDSWFLPTEYINPYLNIAYSDSDAHYWQCFETPGSCSSMDYLGRLTLHIGDTTSVPFEGPFDLAGNHLDSDPYTVTFPRDTITGSWSSSNYEEGFDEAHSWGTALDYSKVSPGYYTGIFCHRYVYVETNDGSVVGDCPYWCGFWLKEDHELPTSPLIVDIVKPDGYCLSTTMYSDADTCGFEDEILSMESIEGRYGWFAWSYRIPWSQQPPYATVRDQYLFATAIDCETLIDITYELGVGNCWSYNSVDIQRENEGPGYISTATFLGINESGSVEVKVGINLFYGGGYCDTLTLDPPSSRNVFTSSLSELSLNNESVQTLIENQFTILPLSPNPASVNVTIPFVLATSGRTTIDVFDIAGRKVGTILEARLQEGGHRLVWDLTDDSGNIVPAGIYHLRLSASGFSGTQSVMVLR